MELERIGAREEKEPSLPLEYEAHQLSVPPFDPADDIPLEVDGRSTSLHQLVQRDLEQKPKGFYATTVKIKNLTYAVSAKQAAKGVPTIKTLFVHKKPQEVT
jgi:hypothetical protein